MKAMQHGAPCRFHPIPMQAIGLLPASGSLRLFLQVESTLTPRIGARGNLQRNGEAGVLLGRGPASGDGVFERENRQAAAVGGQPAHSVCGW